MIRNWKQSGLLSRVFIGISQHAKNVIAFKYDVEYCLWQTIIITACRLGGMTPSSKTCMYRREITWAILV